jgi:hypothetical protein
MICTLLRFLRTTVSAALLTLTLAACSTTPTPYQVVGEDGGYSDQQIESDRYRVKFAGNTATPRETVEDYALYRAAELTLETGKDYFKVVSKEVEPIIGSVRGVSPGIGIGVGGGNVGFGVSTGFGGGRPDYSYVAYLDIVMYEGEKPEEDREAYSAWDVVERLRSEVVGAAEADEESAQSR